MPENQNILAYQKDQNGVFYVVFTGTHVACMCTTHQNMKLMMQVTDSNNIHITSFYIWKEQILNYTKELSEWFCITVAIPKAQIYHSFNRQTSRAITAAVTLLSTPFTRHWVTKNLRSTAQIYWYLKWLCYLHISPVSVMFIGACLGTVQGRRNHVFYLKFMQPLGPISNFFWPLTE
jgi:hypothetical protein